MRKTVAWVAGLVGIAALGRWLARRSRRNAGHAPPGGPAADPAEELRRRLDETRGESPPVPEPDAATGERGIDERRAAVHRQAEDAIAAMRESGL